MSGNNTASKVNFKPVAETSAPASICPQSLVKSLRANNQSLKPNASETEISQGVSSGLSAMISWVKAKRNAYAESN